MTDPYTTLFETTKRTCSPAVSCLFPNNVWSNSWLDLDCSSNNATISLSRRWQLFIPMIVQLSHRLGGGGSRTAPSRLLCKAADWIGAQRPTNNTGGLSAFFHHAVQLIFSSRTPATNARRKFNILTDSEYCARLFADNPVAVAYAEGWSWYVRITSLSGKPRLTAPLPHRMR